MPRQVKRRRVDKCPLQVSQPTETICKSMPVEENDFRNFFLARGYDVISEGRFKRHLMHSREIGDRWAMETQKSIGEIGSRVKHMHEKIRELDAAPCPPVKHVCEMIIAMPLPPNLKEGVTGSCAISKVFSSNNIVIQKKKHDNDRLIVNRHYAHFLIMLWVASKIEYIIRNYTRWWLEKQDENMDINELCNVFANEHEVMEKLRVTFNHAISHICKSVEHHLQESKQF